MTKNYARNVDTGEYLFFESEFIPTSAIDIERWAFFELPAGAIASKFRGRLIGESSDLRAERLGLPVVKTLEDLS